MNGVGVAALLVILCGVLDAEGGLTIGTINCGQKICQRGDYCSEYDRTCRPCSQICNISMHNFEAEKCMKDCQDYIHDQRYQQKGDNGSGGDENLRATVQKLSTIVTVTLTLVCFMLLVLTSVLFIQLYKWKKKKNITMATIRNKLFRKTDSNSNKNTTEQTNGNKPDLRLEIPSPSVQSDHSPITMTTSISRKPAEDDIARDYAYDNPAMTTNPSPTSRQTDNRF